MNANRANDEESMSAVTGNPFRRVFLNMEGAFPAIARPSVIPSYHVRQWRAEILGLIGSGAHIVRVNLCTGHLMLRTRPRSEDMH
jgi:hypothetical protein